MEDNNRKLIVTVIIGLVILITAADMIADLTEGSGIYHILTELGLLVLSSLAVWLIWCDNVELRRNSKCLATDLKVAETEAIHWRIEAESLISGLSQAIDAKFHHWRLTAAEKDVGFLLLKGLSLKEAAGVRGTSERTVRQQAQEIYQKSGISGRAEFAAFFLEDLLAPQKATPDLTREIR